MSIPNFVQDYLKEEIQAEGFVRQLSAFNRFLEIMAYSDCGVSGHTVREYGQILEDTSWHH